MAFLLRWTAFDVGEDIVAFYQMLLKNGDYVRSFCNVKFFPNLHIENDYFHDFLIFGFDDDTGMFDIRAYQDYHLKDAKVSYEASGSGSFSGRESIVDYFIAIIKNTSNKQMRRTNAGSPEKKRRREPFGWHQRAGPSYGFSNREG